MKLVIREDEESDYIYAAVVRNDGTEPLPISILRLSIARADPEMFVIWKDAIKAIYVKMLESIGCVVTDVMEIKPHETN